MTPPPPLSIAQRTWFAVVAVLGVVFMLVLPPFDGADENAHWLRAWTVAEGQLTCGELPQSVVDARYPFRERGRYAMVAIGSFDDALAMPADPYPTTRDYRTSACVYPPYAYAISALTIRLMVYGGDGVLGTGELIKAFVAARLVNWLCLCLVVFWFLRVMPGHRNVTLVFFSIPEVMDHSGPFSADLSQFIMMFAMLAFALRAPTWRRVAFLGLLAVLLAVVKPVFGAIGLLAIPAVLELHAARKGTLLRYVIVGLLLVIGPLLMWKLWVSSLEWLATPAPAPAVVVPAPTVPSPPVVDDSLRVSQQIEYLKAHPFHLFEVYWNQFRYLFSRSLSKGGWISILGSFGAFRVKLDAFAGYALILALGLAAYADHASTALPSVTPLIAKTRRGLAAWIVACGGVAIVGPATILAMYIYTTDVGAPLAHGVQGRYYLTPMFMMLVLGLHYVRGRWPRREVNVRWVQAAVWVALVLCAWANITALRQIADSFWSYTVSCL